MALPCERHILGDGILSTMSNHAFRIGVDLGGTKTEAVVLGVEGTTLRHLCRKRIATPRNDGYEAILHATAALIDEVRTLADLGDYPVSIGVGMPGSVRRDGMIKNSNTTCLNGRPFRQDLVRAVGSEILFANDANCFALAEANWGAGAGHQNGLVFGVILGTGVGGGMVIRGRLWDGPNGIAGEWGHHRVFNVPHSDCRDSHPIRSCYCGHTGCVETYLSGPAVERHFQELSGEPWAMTQIVAAARSNPHAQAAIDLFLESFGKAVANVINILDPSVIVLGGGLSSIPLLYGDGVARVASQVFADRLDTPIVQNQLGDSAGVLGAALLGWEAQVPLTLVLDSSPPRGNSL